MLQLYDSDIPIRNSHVDFQCLRRRHAGLPDVESGRYGWHPSTVQVTLTFSRFVAGVHDPEEVAARTGV
jgi:hypothetical protein